MISQYAMRIAQELYSKPLLLDDGAIQSISNIFQAHLNGDKSARQEEGMCGGAVEVEGMVIEDGVARIPVAGVIVSGMRLPISGLVHTGQIAEEIDEAEASEEVERVEFHFDTPGGMVQGTPELANKIFEMEKPTSAIVQGMACSAGYWLASATDSIIASEGTQVGSIGVYQAYTDISKLLKNQGVEVQVFHTGDLKGMGVPGTSLTDKHKDHIQSQISIVMDKFTEHVKAMRGDDLDSEVFRGQSFYGEQALDLKLVDYVAY